MLAWVLFNTWNVGRLPVGVVEQRPMPSWTELALDCARVARKGLRLPETESPVAVVLGSGLGAFADALTDARALPFAELPGFPPATVPGHKGRMVYGKLAPTSILVLQGRIHGYEGHDAATVALPARVLGALGVRALIVTNAAGSCNPSFAPGDLMRITDHINFTGRNPLTGANEERLGPDFPTSPMPTMRGWRPRWRRPPAASGRPCAPASI